MLQLSRAKRDGALDNLLRTSPAGLVILDEFGYVPFDIDGAVSSTRSSPAANVASVILPRASVPANGDDLADDKLAAAINDRIVHYGLSSSITFGRRVSQALMFSTIQLRPFRGRHALPKPEKSS